MAYAPITVAKGGFVTKTPVRNRFGLFRRVLNAMMVSLSSVRPSAKLHAISAPTDLATRPSGKSSVDPCRRRAAEF